MDNIFMSVNSALLHFCYVLVFKLDLRHKLSIHHSHKCNFNYTSLTLIFWSEVKYRPHIIENLSFHFANWNSYIISKITVDQCKHTYCIWSRCKFWIPVNYKLCIKLDEKMTHKCWHKVQKWDLGHYQRYIFVVFKKLLISL